MCRKFRGYVCASGYFRSAGKQPALIQQVDPKSWQFYTESVTTATVSTEAAELLRRLKAVGQSAYHRDADQQPAESLKQARDSSIKKSSISDVEASTEAVIAQHQLGLN